MTNDELISEAREHARVFADPNELHIRLETLPKVKVMDAVVVYFESDKHNGKIEVVLEKKTGKFISATLSPSK